MREFQSHRSFREFAHRAMRKVRYIRDRQAGFVQKEIKFVLDVADEQPEGRIFIIPARLEDCKVPDRLSRWHWVNLFEDTGYDNLLCSLVTRASELR